MVLACTCRVPCPCPLSEVISWQSIDRAPTGSEDTSASRTGSGPVNLATIRAAITAATCTSPKAAATIRPPPKPPAFTGSIKTDADIRGTRRSPGGGEPDNMRAARHHRLSLLDATDVRVP